MPKQTDLFLLNKQAMAVMLALAATSIYGVIDIYFISLLGLTQLTAAGLASPFMWLFNTLANGFALAISIYTARQQLENNLNQSVFQPMIIGIVSLSIFAFICYEFFLKNSLIYFSNDPEILKQTKLYLSTWIYIYCSTLLFTSCSAMMRGFELYKYQTQIIISSCVLNTIATPILMFEPINLGIIGAVYATAFSQIIAIAIFMYIIKGKKLIVFTFTHIHIQSLLKHLKNLLSTALATATTSILWPISVLIATYFISKLGSIEVAMMGVISKIQPLIMIPIFSISIAVSVWVSKAFQESNFVNIKNFITLSVKLILIWQFFIAILIIIFRENLAKLMLSHSQEGILLLELFLILIPLTVVGRGLIFLLSQTLPAMGRAQYALRLDSIYALILHTLCYFTAYLFGDFTIAIYLLMLMNIIGVLIFYYVTQHLKSQHNL